MKFNSNTSCAAMYNHVTLRPGNVLFPCCRFKRPIGKHKSVNTDILNQDIYKNLRDKASKQQLPECSKCFHEEAIGRESYRQWWNKNFDTNTVSLKHLHIHINNICSLTCDGCGPEWSSSWFKKLNPNTPVKKGYNHTDITYIPDTVEYMEFQGGEPLQTLRHRELLRMHPNPSICTVRYVTNCMHALTDTDIELFNKFKQINFWLSIDGYGDTNDKVRSGSVWKIVEKNALDIASKYVYQVETTLHKNNIFGMPALSNWIKQNNLKWNIFPLTRPRNLDCAYMKDIDKVITIISSIDYEGKKELIAHCNSQSKLTDWISYD
jgi:sulfatase maturation enzyme AslB (radical SAM superfamily)